MRSRTGGTAARNLALFGVRREFVANVSHELRTPLTSIKAFVETLLAGGIEDRENGPRFWGIIGKHADRMQALIDDITDLSRIETGAVELELGPVDAAQLARDVVAQLRPQIELHAGVSDGGWTTGRRRPDLNRRRPALSAVAHRGPDHGPQYLINRPAPMLSVSASSSPSTSDCSFDQPAPTLSPACSNG